MDITSCLPLGTAGVHGQTMSHLGKLGSTWYKSNDKVKTIGRTHYACANPLSVWVKLNTVLVERVTLGKTGRGLDETNTVW